MFDRVMLALFFSLVAISVSAVEPVNRSVTTKVAIRGYDPVAYFNESKAVEGQALFAHRWKGAIWHFSTAGNRDLFAKNPARYAPQYGGYCAFGVSRGYAVAVDPNAWTIASGKLYLNYNQDVQKSWTKDIRAFVEKADANWPRILAGK